MEVLADLARTNYLAAAIRNLIGPVTEVYVKWWYGGAFNGAAWVSCTDSAEVLFYRSPVRVGDGLKLPFSQGTAVVRGIPAGERTLSETIAAAEATFEAAVRRDRQRVINSVRRLQLWIWIESSEAAATAELARVLKSLEGISHRAGSATGVMPMPSPTERWQADIDVELASLQPHDDVLSRLRVLFPQLRGSMFGTGVTWRPEDDRIATQNQIIKGVQFIARQA